MLDGEVVRPVVGVRLVEGAVLLGDVGGVARPDGLGLVELLVRLLGNLLLLRLLLLALDLLDLLDLRVLLVFSLLVVLNLLRVTSAIKIKDPPRSQ